MGAGHFDNNFDMLSPVFAIGSYERNTLCARERDIDLMACLTGFGPDNLWDRFQDNSSQFLYWIRNRLNDYYYSTDVSSKRVCVKLDFTDIVTDVTPCFLNGHNGFVMPNGSGGWMATNPPFHADLMSNADNAKGGKLKPVIRLIKAWNIANGHHLSSFHLEMMIEAAQRPYRIFDHDFEAWWTLRTLSWRVKNWFYDPWPAGGERIDTYLSDEMRSRLSRKLELDAMRAETARHYATMGRTAAAFERWNVIYNGTFPAYG